MSAIDSRVVVSCAGGGKTSALINRLMSLLRSGAAPGEILAITFTNKAAGEIRARLLANLEREAQTDSEMAALRRRILLSASPKDALSVHTFHGWFLTLLRHRPGGFFSPPNIRADSAAVFDESWRRWQKRAEESPSSELKTVLRELTPAALRKMCEQFLGHYAVYRAYAESPRPAFSAADPDAECERRRRAVQKTAAAFAESVRNSGGKTTIAARDAAARLAEGKTTPADEQKCFFTGEGAIRSALEKDAGKHNAAAQLRKLAAALNAFFARQEERRAREFNAAALSVCADFAHERDALLQARNEITFDDLEWGVCAMLREPGMRGHLSYRLAARCRHILIDEFQDTSPMQWRVVREWLRDAHGEDGPTVFIVGDPKQAIYGFRHGDSRLLGEAEEFLREYYGARRDSPQNKCFRCAKNIVGFVNAVFDEKTLPGFVPHRAAGANGNGRVEWNAYQDAPPPPPRARIRDPLRDIESAAEKPARRAREVAAKVAEILREWQIPDGETRRRVRPEDILILMPQRTHAAALTDALSAEDISCAGGGGSFLESFECADILDLVAVLLSPGRDYALARVLKSPLFALTDDELAEIAALDGDSLWEKLRRRSSASSRRARTLLKLWRRRAETTALPAHDFLSRLFVQGDVFVRYRAASPPPLHSRVRENLSRLLDLSLQIAGGARPLLSQFLDEVRRADAEDARAESDSSPSAVRLMSIHAAKGLESPVVVLTDSDLTRTGGRGDSTDIFADWPPSADAAEDFVVSLRRHRRAYPKLKQKAKEAKEREEMNLFYVAVTRAKNALVIFSAAKPAGVAARAERAMRRLSSARPGDARMAFGDSFSAPAAPPSLPQPPAVARETEIGRRTPRTAAAVRGEIRHRIIALLLSGIPPATARHLVAAEDAQWSEAETMASSPPLQKLLQNAEEVLVERDFFIGGEIVRPDLVVAKDGAVWIVDYKTGDPSLSRHRPQLETYRRAVAVCHPGAPMHLAVLDIRGKMHYLDSE